MAGKLSGARVCCVASLRLRLGVVARLVTESAFDRACERVEMARTTRSSEPVRTPLKTPRTGHRSTGSAPYDRPMSAAIAFVVGARPNFMKTAPVYRGIADLAPQLELLLVHTGQHYDADMSDVFFRDLDLPTPDVVLGVASGTHAEQTARALVGIERILLAEKPALVVVCGDVNSTLAGALAAVKLHIPVAHVEAGLRSFNRAMPEEINRVVTDHVSSRLFCPTVTAEKNLRNEGVNEGVDLVGDVMYDALEEMRPQLSRREESLLTGLGVSPRSYVLATIHRPSNTDEPERLRSLLATLDEVEWPVVFPVH